MNDLELQLTLAMMPFGQNELLQGEIDVFKFLDAVENINPTLAIRAERILQGVMAKIDYSALKARGLAKPRLLTRPGMPLHIGGYFIPDTDYVVLNPITLLYGSQEQIEAETFRIVQHETNHYGGILDESVTDLLAQLQMEEAGFGTDTRNGYHDLVALLLENLTSGITADDLIELIDPEDNFYTLCNFIDAIFINKVLKQKGFVDFKEIKQLISRNWGIIQKLFPRLLNEIFAPHKGLHEPANEIKLDTGSWWILEQKYLEKCISLELHGDGHTLVNES